MNGSQMISHVGPGFGVSADEAADHASTLAAGFAHLRPFLTDVSAMVGHAPSELRAGLCGSRADRGTRRLP
ncbi:MAG: hypothetical protein HOW73_32540 [Polyangiaceae bacterium]|nr:hypothetical protein [Polyangiaceae bacterium]